jgi:hypothetical protein
MFGFYSSRLMIKKPRKFQLKQVKAYKNSEHFGYMIFMSSICHPSEPEINCGTRCDMGSNFGKEDLKACTLCLLVLFGTVLRIRTLMSLGLLDPDPNPLV